MRFTRALAAAALSVLLVACGGGDGGAFDQATSERLLVRLDHIRDAVFVGDTEGAQAQLRGLTVAVTRQVDEGTISRERGDEILDAAAAVQVELATFSPASTTTSASVTTVPSDPVPLEGEGDEGNGNEGRGNGNGNDD